MSICCALVTSLRIVIFCLRFMDENIKHRMQNMLDGFGALAVLAFKGLIGAFVVALALLLFAMRISLYIIAALVLYKMYDSGSFWIF